MSYASWSVVFGEQPSAAKWNILGTNDASFNDGTGISNGVILPNHLKTSASSLNTWVWDTYTPTLTNVTTGNGTLTARYMKIGNTVFAKGVFTLGTTSSISGAVSIALPVTASSTAVSALGTIIGGGVAVDSGTFAYPLDVVYSTTTTMVMNARITIVGANPQYLDITNTRQMSNTVPITFGTNDSFTWQIMYEAA